MPPLWKEPSPGASQGKEGTFFPWGEPEGVQKTHRVLSHPKSGGKHLCPVAQPKQGMQSCPSQGKLGAQQQRDKLLAPKNSLARQLGCCRQAKMPGTLQIPGLALETGVLPSPRGVLSAQPFPNPDIASPRCEMLTGLLFLIQSWKELQGKGCWKSQRFILNAFSSSCKVQHL